MKDDSLLYKQLTNNITEAFLPPEYAIANRFYVDGWTEKEVTDILKKCETLSQIYSVRIHNAFRDIMLKPKKYENAGLWQNEQLYRLKMLNLRK